MLHEGQVQRTIHGNPGPTLRRVRYRAERLGFMVLTQGLPCSPSLCGTQRELHGSLRVSRSTIQRDSCSRDPGLVSRLRQLRETKQCKGDVTSTPPVWGTGCTAAGAW